MVESSGLKIPYEDLQKYIKIYDVGISGLVDQEKIGMITRTQLEERLPSAFLLLKDCEATILKDNKIVDNQHFAEHDRKVLAVFSDSINKI
jgi:hypothetical protein